jgi:hypothetical protein
LQQVESVRRDLEGGHLSLPSAEREPESQRSMGKQGLASRVHVVDVMGLG